MCTVVGVKYTDCASSIKYLFQHSMSIAETDISAMYSHKLLSFVSSLIPSVPSCCPHDLARLRQAVERVHYSIATACERELCSPEANFNPDLSDILRCNRPRTIGCAETVDLIEIEVVSGIVVEKIKGAFLEGASVCYYDGDRREQPSRPIQGLVDTRHVLQLCS